MIAGTAAKVLTGALIPEGADAVIMYEKTKFTDEDVALFAPVKAGDNIVWAGEDVRKGTVLAQSGTVIDPVWQVRWQRRAWRCLWFTKCQRCADLHRS